METSAPPSSDFIGSFLTVFRLVLLAFFHTGIYPVESIINHHQQQQSKELRDPRSTKVALVEEDSVMEEVDMEEAADSVVVVVDSEVVEETEVDSKTESTVLLLLLLYDGTHRRDVFEMNEERAAAKPDKALCIVQ